MSLQLDARQRRMLACMGIHTQWLPRAPLRAAAPSVHVQAPEPVPAPVLGTAKQGIDSMDPAMRSKPLRELQQTYQAQTKQAATAVEAATETATPAACLRFFSAQGQVVAAVPQGAWLLLFEPSAAAGGPDAAPLSADALALLHNILQAAQIAPEQVLLAALPEGQEAGAAAACLAQLQQSQPALLMLLGRKACAWVLGQESAVGQLRGQAHLWQGWPAIASYPLDYLLRMPEAKIRAWEDWLLALHSGAATSAAAKTADDTPTEGA